MGTTSNKDVIVSPSNVNNHRRCVGGGACTEGRPKLFTIVNAIILLFNLIVLCSLLIGAGPPGIGRAPLEVTSLVLKDKNGNTRAVLGGEADGSCLLRFWEPGRSCRLSLGVTSNGLALVEICDANGDSRIRLGSRGDGSSTLSFLDSNVPGGPPRVRADFSTGANGTLGLSLRSTDESIRLGAFLAADGKVGIGLSDKGGQKRVDIHCSKQNQAAINLITADGRSWLGLAAGSDQRGCRPPAS